jgi:hypothetical protein
MRRYHHIGIPTDESRRGERYPGREILIAPNNPSNGVCVTFVVENGAPIELLEFTDPNHPARRRYDS